MLSGSSEDVPRGGIWGRRFLVHEKGFWPGDLGELVMEVPESGQEWRIVREDVAGNLGR